MLEVLAKSDQPLTAYQMERKGRLERSALYRRLVWKRPKGVKKGTLIERGYVTIVRKELYPKTRREKKYYSLTFRGRLAAFSYGVAQALLPLVRRWKEFGARYPRAMSGLLKLWLRWVAMLHKLGSATWFEISEACFKRSHLAPIAELLADIPWRSIGSDVFVPAFPDLEHALTKYYGLEKVEARDVIRQALESGFFDYNKFHLERCVAEVNRTYGSGIMTSITGMVDLRCMRLLLAFELTPQSLESMFEQIGALSDPEAKSGTMGEFVRGRVTFGEGEVTSYILYIERALLSCRITQRPCPYGDDLAKRLGCKYVQEALNATPLGRDPVKYVNYLSRVARSKIA